MNETARQRIWLVAVLVLATLSLSQFVTNRNVRAELEKNRIDYAQLRGQIDQRALTLVADKLRERRRDVIDAGYSLHAFYESKDGLARPEGLWINGRPDFEGIGAWLFDVYLSARLTGATDEEARQKMVTSIKQSDEWRQKHPNGQ